MKVLDMKKAIAELVEALIWCSGSSDFVPRGQAHEGWVKTAAPAISNGKAIIQALPDGQMIAVEE
jgi:hypothetical protein